MKPENLFRAMNEIDPSIIEGSENYKAKSNAVRMKHYIPLAACACFAIVLLAVVPNAINKKNMASMAVEEAPAAAEAVAGEAVAEEAAAPMEAFDMAEAVEEEKMIEEAAEESADESDDSGATMGIASLGNPMKEASKEEILELDGVEMNIPEDATNQVWNRIEDSDGVMIDEVAFLYGDTDYCYRVKATDGFVDISGMYFSWGDIDSDMVPEGSPAVFLDEESQVGLIVWYADGHSYALSTFNASDSDLLIQMRNMIMH